VNWKASASLKNGSPAMAYNLAFIGAWHRLNKIAAI
jgi:hypothetical protein